MGILELREHVDRQLQEQYRRRRPDDPAVNLRKTLVDELIQLDEEGCEIDAATAELLAADVLSMDVATVEAHLARLEGLPMRPGFQYEEPSDLAEIQAARPDGRPIPAADDDHYDRRLRGAWIGRCAGCTLGKPIEGWSRAEIRELLDTADIGDLRFYVPYLEPNPTGRAWHPSAVYSAQGRIDGVPRDDDIDYCILALEILETYGPCVTTADFGQSWLEMLPYWRVYTAERAAYRNLVLGLPTSEAATTRNPYREWIGAQIRADVLGWVNPGRPEAAAALAFRDAALSHVKNGIYGEMWAAATIAAAFSLDDPLEAVRAGMDQIPAKSRLHEALTNTLAWSEEYADWQDAWERVDEAYGHYNFVHTINNACFVVLGLTYGRGDFAATVGIAVECGEDTDCNGATAGSILGATKGAEVVPAVWTEHFHDRVETIVSGIGTLRLSDLIARTAALARGPFAA
ncbi:MAG: ADP-ribosylglycohydrolase family protein [Chloroflexota bacterium]|nr:ADP-ribosylglycohydrolase family protein [Chloroflexota bacterium]